MRCIRRSKNCVAHFIPFSSPSNESGAKLSGIWRGALVFFDIFWYRFP